MTKVLTLITILSLVTMLGCGGEPSEESGGEIASASAPGGGASMGASTGALRRGAPAPLFEAIRWM